MVERETKAMWRDALRFPALHLLRLLCAKLSLTMIGAFPSATWELEVSNSAAKL
jgi:hypothetical protein